MDAEAFGAVAHRRVLEAEAGRAALRVVGVQVEVTQLTPDEHMRQNVSCRRSELSCSARISTEVRGHLMTLLHSIILSAGAQVTPDRSLHFLLFISPD